MQLKKPTQCPICGAAAIRSVAYLVQFACGSRSDMVLRRERDGWRMTRVCRRRQSGVKLAGLVKSYGAHAKAGDIMTRRLNEILGETA